MKKIELYTDGACRGNQSSMGIGAIGGVLIYNGVEKEFSEAYRTTTNGRMEIMAVIRGFSLLKEKCKVTVYSDAKYVTDSFNKRWIDKWQSNGWKKSNKKPVENQDLWCILLELMEGHDVEFVWVKGHSNNKYNEKCDELANKAMDDGRFLIDEKYEDKMRDCEYLSLFDDFVK